MNIVELRNVDKSYAGIRALSGLNLALPEGEVLGLFGHNGAGKTTTIKLILGLIEPSAGDIRVFGVRPDSHAARQQRRALGFLQENVAFYEQLSGEEVLRYFARLKGAARSQCRQLLEEVGLGAVAKRRVKTYSKGMRQRLGLAQALLGEPRLLLLDEPTVGLDPIATREFYERVARLKARGCTLILCSHVLPGVERYIDRALILGNGRLLAEGSLDQLRQSAELPLTLTVSGAGLRLPEDLAARAVAGRDGLQLQVPLAEKIATLQRLLPLPGLDNLDLHPPSLEDLYSHFIQGAANGQSETGA